MGDTQEIKLSTTPDPNLSAYLQAVVNQQLLPAMGSQYGGLTQYLSPYVKPVVGMSDLQQQAAGSISGGLNNIPGTYGAINNWAMQNMGNQNVAGLGLYPGAMPQPGGAGTMGGPGQGVIGLGSNPTPAGQSGPFGLQVRGAASGPSPTLASQPITAGMGSGSGTNNTPSWMQDVMSSWNMSDTSPEAGAAREAQLHNALQQQSPEEQRRFFASRRAQGGVQQGPSNFFGNQQGGLGQSGGQDGNLLQTPWQSDMAAGYLSQIPGMASQRVGMQAPERQALGQINQLTGGPIGSSAATQAGLQAFEEMGKEGIQNDLNTMGLGRSGIGADIINRSRSSAMLPLIQQEIANRQAAVGQLSNLGGTFGARETDAINRGMTGLGAAATGFAGLGGQDISRLGQAGQLALSGAGLQNQIQQGAANTALNSQQSQNNYTNNLQQLAMLIGQQQQQTSQAQAQSPWEDFLRRQNLALGITLPGGGVPTGGAATSSTQTSPNPGFFG